MIDLQEIDKALVRVERAVERRVGEARIVAEQGKKAQTDVKELEQDIEYIVQAISVLNSYADVRQNELQEKIETLVTHGLRTIFDEDMSFHLISTHHGKLAATDFVVRSTVDGESVDTSIMDARGGGVAAVVGFLLRLVVLLLRKDSRPVLFLDETFAQLSAEYEPKLAEFLRELVDRTPVQIILVTHSDAYSDFADAKYRFSLKNGTTKIVKE